MSFKLFSGTAHPQLAKQISDSLHVPLAKAEVVRFGNSEVKVTIQEDVKNQACFVIQATSNPTDTNLMELLFFCDALKREEAKKIIAIIPYFGYAKQNIQHRKGECVSVNVVIRFLESIGFNKVYAIDIHDEATGGVFDIPFRNLSAFPLLAEEIKRYFINKKIIDVISPDKIALVSPDQGAVEKVRKFGNIFFNKINLVGANRGSPILFPIIVIEKKRDQNIAHKASPLGIYGDVKGKIVLIVDDMVVSGSTMIPAIDLCLNRGAKAVYTCAVHHDFTSSAPEKLQNSKLEKFFTTNTIALKKEQIFPKLIEFSISSLISGELK